MAGEELRVPIAIPVETNAAQAADSVEALRDRIASSRDVIRDASSALRNLRGSSDVVKAAKDQLKATINAEKDATSAATLKLLKHGTSYDTAAAKAKKLALESKNLADKMKADGMKAAKERADHLNLVMAKMGGPIEAARGKWGELTSVLGGAGGAMTLAIGLAAGLVAGVVALGAATLGAVVSFGKFVFEGSNAARTLGLFREAALGTAENAAAMGRQLDVLGDKVSTPIAKLNEMSIALAKTRLSGQQQVDTLNAVAQASDAMGDQVGKTLEDIVTRSQMTQRMFIGPRELFGTGLEFQDVAKSLAKNMSVGIAQAQAALLNGRVKLDDGAKAIRDAVEKRFGDVNARKMLGDLGGMWDKVKSRLTKGVNLDPILKGAEKFLKFFSDSTLIGFELRELIERMGNGLVKVFTNAGPIAEKVFGNMVLLALNVEGQYLKLRLALQDAFSSADAIKNAQALTDVTWGLGKAADAANFGLKFTKVILDGISVALKDTLKSWVALDQAFHKTMGGNITGGLVDGMKAGAPGVAGAVDALGNLIKKRFEKKLEIQSPSKVGHRLGKQFPAGVEGGIEAGTPAVAAAASDMGGGMATAASSGGGGGGRSSLTLNLTINVAPGGNAPDIAAALSAPSFLQSLTKAVEDLLVSAGRPVQNA